MLGLSEEAKGWERERYPRFYRAFHENFLDERGFSPYHSLVPFRVNPWETP